MIPGKNPASSASALLILLALAPLAEPLATPPAARRAASEDGAVWVEVPPGWTVERPKSGRSLELRAAGLNRVLILGEWRDGATPAPPEPYQARIKGAETAMLTRKGAPAITYARRPSKRGSHLQGWLSCGGDRYLFDASVERDEMLWPLLETLACRGRAAGAGVDIGKTGWRLTLPDGFQREGEATDIKGIWLRAWDATARDPSGNRVATRHEQRLWIMTGSEIWSASRPWPGTCKFANRAGVVLEAPQQRLHDGKTTFLYSCHTKDADPAADPKTLVYDLIYDYDSTMGNASFITVRLDHRMGFVEGTFWTPPPPPPDQTLFRRVIERLERSGASSEESGPPEPHKPAAVPLLRER